MIDFFQWRNNKKFPKISNEKLNELKNYLDNIAGKKLLINITNEKIENEEYRKIINEMFNEISKYNKNPSIKTKLSYYIKKLYNDIINQPIKTPLYEGKISGGVILLFIISILSCIIMLLLDKLNICKPTEFIKTLIDTIL